MRDWYSCIEAVFQLPFFPFQIGLIFRVNDANNRLITLLISYIFCLHICHYTLSYMGENNSFSFTLPFSFYWFAKFESNLTQLKKTQKKYVVICSSQWSFLFLFQKILFFLLNLEYEQCWWLLLNTKHSVWKSTTEH